MTKERALKLKPVSDFSEAADNSAVAIAEPDANEEPTAQDLAEVEEVLAEFDSKNASQAPAKGNADDARNYPVLTVYQRYMRDVLSSELGSPDLLTPAEEIELAGKIKSGDAQARERMIVCNLRLVAKIAGIYEGLGLPVLDLINEGNMGLMKAVEKFDPAKGAKLSTYAGWWIKQAMKRALANQSRTIRVPVHESDRIWKIKRTETRLHGELGREPTDEEIAAEMDISVEKLGRLRKASMMPSSLDAQIENPKGGGTTTWADLVADAGAADPSGDAELTNDLTNMRWIFDSLDEREQRILTLRFGLDGQGERTLEEIGQQFGVTRERIRQLQNGALEKIRRKMDRLDRDPQDHPFPVFS